MNDDFTKDEGQTLWRQAIAAAQPSTAKPVSALDLAAWIDGRADERLSARVEAALACDPILLDMALAASAARSEPASQASERLVVRARALVAPQIKQANRNSGWLSGLGAWRRGAEWAVIGLCMLVAAGAGVWIGGDVGDNLLSETTITSLFDDDTGLGGLLSPTEDL
jgi:hypothetical protein